MQKELCKTCVLCRHRDRKLHGGWRYLLDEVTEDILVQKREVVNGLSWVKVPASSYLCLTHPKIRARFKPEEVMTPSNPRWGEFCTRLEGPEACDFKRDAAGKISFRCGGGTDKTKSISIMKKMGVDAALIKESCFYFESHGGFCDCEIIFNIRDALSRPLARSRNREKW